jgi:hypothetical protein
LDAANILSYSFGMSQNSHVYQHFRMQEVGSAAIPQFTRAGSDNQIGVLASFGAAINAGATQDRLTSGWGGPATISVSNVNQAVAMNVFLLDPGIIAGGSPLYGVANSGIIWAFSAAIGGRVCEAITLPYGPVVIRHTNTGANPATPTTTIIRGPLS